MLFSKFTFRSKSFTYLIFTIFGIGLLFRILPLFNQGGRLLRQWPTEDGYLMLTIARNIAIGNGMSIADGTIATNGTQPLFNFMEAICFALVGGDKELGVFLALILQIIISLIAIFFLFLLADYVLQQRPNHQEIAALTAVIWYCSPLIMGHTMNCLETGLYVTLILISTYIWLRHGIESKSHKFSLSVIWVGILLGFTCWARIDAVFFLGAITLWHVLIGFIYEKQYLIKRIAESCVMGTTAVLVFSPWLLYNKLNFGSFTPISGTAQSFGSSFASNSREVPSTLFEYATLLLPIPNNLEKTIPVLLFNLLFISVYLVMIIVIATRMNKKERVLLYCSVTFASFLIIYYGFFFGAAHFVSRYLFPISPFMAIFTTTIIFYGLQILGNYLKFENILPITMFLIIGLSISLNGRFYKGGYKAGSSHLHFQVVEWVTQNVGESVWVGAIQTGTLGFFHDRTVNLDGKVNPDALRAKIQRKIPEYVVTQEFDANGNRIDYLADWFGIASWAKLTPIKNNFDLILNDRENNLAVLKRKSPAKHLMN
jgi:hypothetical protein